MVSQNSWSTENKRPINNVNSACNWCSGACAKGEHGASGSVTTTMHSLTVTLSSIGPLLNPLSHHTHTQAPFFFFNYYYLCKGKYIE